MPTGYTAFIEDGDITTGKDFLLLCSRAFGVAVDIRDKPLSVPTPTHFEPNEYYKRRYEDAVKRLEDGKDISFEDAKAKMRTQHDKRVEDAKRSIKRMSETNKRYAEIRSQILEWTPPSEEHSGIKKFALEQIDMCVNKESMFMYYDKIIAEQFDDSDAAICEYIIEYIEGLQSDVARTKRDYEADVERAEQRTSFMKAFVESLENM